jgi:hypothetical protein
MLFRKKPVMIEATKFHALGDHPAVKRAYFAEDGKCRWVQGDNEAINIFNCRKGYYITTLEGGHEVTPGDWIITGVKGEQYPCKPDIFEATYEAAEPLRDGLKPYGA